MSDELSSRVSPENPWSWVVIERTWNGVKSTQASEMGLELHPLSFLSVFGWVADCLAPVLPAMATY